MLHSSNFRFRVFLAPWKCLVVGVFLGGCVGSDVGIPSPTQYDDILADIDAKLRRYQASDFTRVSELPERGLLTYHGFIAMQLDENESFGGASYAGEVTIGIDFAVGAFGVSGVASGFSDSTGSSVGGQIQLGNGNLNRDESPEIDAVVRFSGTGQLDDSDQGVLDINVQFAADFFGETYEALIGTFEGVAEAKTFDTRLSGILATER